MYTSPTRVSAGVKGMQISGTVVGYRANRRSLHLTVCFSLSLSILISLVKGQYRHPVQVIYSRDPCEEKSNSVARSL